MKTKTVRVLVVEDFLAFRRYVCSILAKVPGLQIVGEASDGIDAVEQAMKLKPDLIFLDLGLPRLNGIEVARRIRKFSREPKIVFLSQEADVETVREALGFGEAYLLKSASESNLLPTLSAVLETPPIT